MSDNHAEEYNRKQVEESEAADKIYRETIKALQTEERFVNFFKNYNAQSVEGFIKYYASQKTNWYKYGNTFYNYRQSKKNVWRNSCIEMLKEIFSKKVFDLKCRWVAGEMDLPGIETSYDFYRWEKNPALCEAVEPITPKELGCYLSYLDLPEEAAEEESRSSLYRAFVQYHHDRAYAWEDSHEMIPRWFHYYDRHFGTAPLLLLPVTRVEIEEDYKEIWSIEIHQKTLPEEQRKNHYYVTRQQRVELNRNPEKRKAHQEEQNRKWKEEEKKRPKYEHISVHDRKKMDELVSLIETPEVRDWYRASRDWYERGRGEDRIFSELIGLKDAKEFISIESNDDYREAIKNAYEGYADRMKRETLPFVFEEYRETVMSKKAFNWKTNDLDSGSDMVTNTLKEHILAVRKLKGQPENFDFLKKENLPKN